MKTENDTGMMRSKKLHIMQINGKGCSVYTPKELLDAFVDWDYSKTACENWSMTEDEWFEERAQYENAFKRAKKKYEKRHQELGQLRGSGSAEKRSVKLSAKDSAILLRNRLHRWKMSRKPIDIFRTQLLEIDDFVLRTRMAYILWWNYDCEIPATESILFDGINPDDCFRFCKKNGIASLINYPAKVLYAEHIRFGESPIDARKLAVAGARTSSESRKGNVEQYMATENGGGA